MEYKLVPLATCPHLTNEVVSLLNSEWPRSTTMRRRSIDKALNMKPPMSLVMYYENELEPIKEIVVGHAKLCLIPCENESACWIESVIIKSNLRGKKLGLFLMNELEKFAINFNFDTMYLSTHDKKIFYEKCGFRICEPVENVGANSELFRKYNFLNSPASNKCLKNVDIKIQSPIIINNINENFTNIPPPPPLLNPLISSTINGNINKEDRKIFMKKILR